jgi:hypothetical protein
MIPLPTALTSSHEQAELDSEAGLPLSTFRKKHNYEAADAIELADEMALFLATSRN